MTLTFDPSLAKIKVDQQAESQGQTITDGRVDATKGIG